MARAKYTINDEDLTAAYDWINKKVQDVGYIEGDFELRSEANKALSQAWRTAEALNTWAEKYLTAAQWKQLKNAVRAARKRRAVSFRNRKRSIDLEPQAHAILKHIAERDGVTLSEVIIKYLNDEYYKGI